MTPEQVKLLQTFLNAIGARDPNGRQLVVDGNFGRMTEYALTSAAQSVPQELNALKERIGLKNGALEQGMEVMQKGRSL